MPTDLERLHDVIQNRAWYAPRSRRVGKTYADAHILAGTLAVTDKAFVLCSVPCMDRVDHILNTLSKVLPEHGIQIVTRRRRDVEVAVPSPDGHDLIKTLRFITHSDREARHGMDCMEVGFRD